MENLNTYELEMTVLGCLLLGAPIEDIKEHVTANDFQSAEHRKLFNAIEKQIASERPVDAVTLMEQGLDISSVSKVHEHCASAANATHYAKQLADYSVTRQIREELAAANSELTPQNHLEVISKVRHTFDLLTDREIKLSTDWQHVIAAGVAAIDNCTTRKSQVFYSSLPCLDTKFASIDGARLIILAARPGTGKTALAQQIALSSAKQGKSIGIISLEMSVAELAIRAFANCFNVNGTSLARGNMTDLSEVLNNTDYSKFSEYNIFVDDNIYDLEKIIARLSQWKRKHHLDFAIIDHIGLINVQHNGTRNESLGIVSRSLKQLCKRLNMPILCLCQLNRHLEKENREPRLSDIRESGHIEQDADMIIMITSRDNDDIGFKSNDHKTILPYLVKNRVGPIGRLPCCTFKGRTQQFIQN